MILIRNFDHHLYDFGRYGLLKDASDQQSFPDVIVLGEVSLLIFEGTEPPLDHDIVGPAALAIHALKHLIFPEKRLVFVTGKLASLVRI